MKKRKKCKCQIRGIVRMARIDKDIFRELHSDECGYWLRQFKYCPICGKEIVK